MCTKKKSRTHVQYHTSRDRPPYLSHGHLSSPWGEFPALHQAELEVEGLYRWFLRYLEVVSDSEVCGHFSVRRNGHGIIQGL